MKNDSMPRNAEQAPVQGLAKAAPSKRFPTPRSDAVAIATVGGVGQIGMNWTLYGHAGKWILVDAGSAFAPRDVEGVDAIFPDPRSLAGIIPNLLALVVTHAHEDHIGAIHRLWPDVGCKIVASNFAAHILKGRFREKRGGRTPEIQSFAPGDSFDIGPFAIESVRMTHSVPECVALAIKTPVGTVLHTGDWKFDPDPVIGKPADLHALKRIGDRGVLAMVCDSTNAERPGKISSERQVAKGFEAVFRKTTGMTVISCFASNVARMASVARAAQATGKVVALAGRSMLRMEEAARACGLLEGVPAFMTDLRHLGGLDRREIVLLCTGTQGEARAALGRLAYGDERLPKIQPGDTVIHSARAIPGNEAEIEDILGRLGEKGARVLTGEFEGHPLHVTGHATSDEITTLYGLVRPRVSIPVHGEAAHLEAHAKLALAAGAKEVVMTTEGDVIMVTRRVAQRVAHVDVELVCALSDHGNRIVPWSAARKEPVLRKPKPKPVFEAKKRPVEIEVVRRRDWRRDRPRREEAPALRVA